MYEEGANPDCTVEGCHGEGILFHYFKNPKTEELDCDWSYCQVCFPQSNSRLIHPFDPDWREITGDEFQKLLYQGWRDIS